MSKHTPGPWYTDATANATHMGFWSTETGALVGETARGVHDSGEFCTDDEMEANARLIAAAPELLEALQEILEYAGGADNALEDQYVMERAAAAIAKAEGGEA